MPLIQSDTYTPSRAPATSEWQAVQEVVAEAAKEQKEREPLDRLQRSLIWFAAILIAISLYQSISNLLF